MALFIGYWILNGVNFYSPLLFSNLFPHRTVGNLKSLSNKKILAAMDFLVCSFRKGCSKLFLFSRAGIDCRGHVCPETLF